MNFAIGVDGGGTKTEFILVDAAGMIVARRLGPGCNPSLVDPATIRTFLSEHLHALATEAAARDAAARVTRVLLCMAGNRQFWRELAPRLSAPGPVETFDDSLPVLELATAGAPGLVLHSGTGSFVAARGPDDRIHYAGGIGWRYGDAASSYELGRRAVARTLLELQGWAARSDLGAALCARVNLTDATALSRRFNQPDLPPTAVAELAPLVTAGVAAGDPAATEIFRASVAELAGLARAVLTKLFPAGEIEDPNSKTENPPIPVGLSGSILQLPAAAPVLTATLGPRVVLRTITAPPIEGVRRLLARL